ncbi:hypothetical protein J2Y48_004802 [Mycoplana sp. BE70]|nr:hypothetical protein [Mycoplana sp. BE70]
MIWSNATCPVTDEPAREMDPRIGDNVEFVCRTCGHFRVTGSALKTMRHFPVSARQRALSRATDRAARDGSMPTLTAADLQ